jgi:hypothetical protein
MINTAKSREGRDFHQNNTTTHSNKYNGEKIILNCIRSMDTNPRTMYC